MREVPQMFDDSIIFARRTSFIVDRLFLGRSYYQQYCLSTCPSVGPTMVTP